MQSTKEEYPLSIGNSPRPQTEKEALLLLHQKRLLSSQHQPPERILQTGSEKLLVVLLVASATVCFLTNLLVFLILTFSTRKDYNKGRKVKLVLRYQLMRNQALAGLLTTTIVIYPLKILATSFEQHQHQLEDGTWKLSEASCLLLFTFPLVVGPLISQTHSLALYAELILRCYNLQKHLLLLASQKLVQRALGLLMFWPLILAGLSNLFRLSGNVCYKSWSMTYWALVLGCTISLGIVLVGLFVFHKFAERRPPKPDSTHLVSSYHGANFAGGFKKGQQKASTNAAANAAAAVQTTDNSHHSKVAHLMVHTLDPPPFLDLSLPSATILNYLIHLLLFIPSLVHLKPNAEPYLYPVMPDSFLLWTQVLVLVGGSVTPVLHLMTDEAVSSLGLDMMRRNTRHFRFKRKDPRERDEGHINESYDESL